MEKNPLVSICMPAYNAEKYISQAIESILGQTYANWELVIVNDGSVDNTLAIAETFTDKRIKIINQPNRGQCAAANTAFNNSTGELIKFFDADDILSSGFIQNQVFMLNNTSNCVATAQWGRFYNDDLNTFKLNKKIINKNLATEAWLITAWEDAQPMMQCGLWLIPRHILDKSGLWDEELSLINDFDLFTRVLTNAKEVIFCADAVLYYRSGIQNSLSGLKTRAGFESAFKSIKKATTNLLKLHNTKQARQSCANIWQSLIFDIYPDHPDIIADIKNEMKGLEKPDLKFDCNGYSKMALPFFGWKLVKKMQRLKKTLQPGN